MVFNKFSAVTLILMALGICTTVGFADARETKIEQNIQSWSVGMGATRIIYNPESSGAIISVNNPNDYPVLVQSKVSTASKREPAPFVVTPPLFRLDAHQQSNLRIIMTGDASAKDRETLYWLCATGIPPKQDEAWAKDVKINNADVAVINVKIKASQCIKLLVRPAAIKGHPEQQATSVIWSVEGGKLKATNPTPYYMNLTSLKVDGQDIYSPELISPMSSTLYSMNGKHPGKVVWEIVNDFGGMSGPFESPVH